MTNTLTCYQDQQGLLSQALLQADTAQKVRDLELLFAGNIEI